MGSADLNPKTLKTLTPGKRTFILPKAAAWHVPNNVAPNQRVGLLGGSFNPAHSGHLEISVLAIDLLKLDEIWWLVTPQNPLKSEDDMAPLAERLHSAQRIVADQPIQVTDIESELGSTYTAETLLAIKDRYPEVHFVWMMGADNLCQIHRWRHWSRLFYTVPIAVFARPTYSLRAENSKAARRFARYRIKPYRAESLVIQRAPAWIVFKRPLNPTSASKIRAGLT